MALTPEEQAELDALIAEGAASRSKAENPETPSPMEQHMDEVDPEGAKEQPPRLTQPNSDPENKPGFLQRLKESLGAPKPALSPQAEVARAALPEVPVGAQDRVGFDALTRGWGDKATAAITGTTIEEQRAKTKQAEIEAGDSAGGFRFAGEIAPYFALGAGAGGLLRAMGTGAALSMADRTASTEGHEDRLPDGEELLVSGIFGMGGGAVGNLVGRGASGLWNKLTHGKEALPAYVMRAIEREGKIVDGAGKAIDASGVVVSKGILGKLSKTIEKNVKGITPDGTPKAWQAFQHVKAGLETGEDLTLRQLNELRRSLSEMKGKRFEQKYIRTIGNNMNDAIKNLPGQPGVKGNVQQGVEAWSKMNKHFQDKLKLDTMAEKMALAQARAQTGKVTFDKAMQDEFSKWTTSKAGKREFDNVFTKEEQKVLIPLTRGPASTQTFNRLDRIFAKGYTGNLLRVVRASLAHAPAAQISKEQFGKAFSQMPGGLPMPQVSQIPQRAAASSAIVGGNEQLNTDKDYQ